MNVMPHNTVLLSSYTPLLYTLIITIIHLFIEMNIHHKHTAEFDEHKARLEKLSKDMDTLSDDWKFNATQAAIRDTQTEIRAIDERLTAIEKNVKQLQHIVCVVHQLELVTT